ncbi:hypothetical protein LDENG_00053480 [Lucifuga dentata]|nr:hypothetical protein LDENG_00053480 [Lucifuga dentata]
MSWAEEDWTVGLSGLVLQKVKELQVQQERLSRENRQKQLQLDNSQVILEKNTVKYEKVRVELQYVQRELQSVQEQTQTELSAKERLSQELQTKQVLVCSLEGQLDTARTLNSKLTQEVKRLEAELEKLQNSTRLADMSPFSTPCWNVTSPWEHSGGRKEERTGQRDEGESRAVRSRQRLQFSDEPTASLPRTQYKSSPHRQPSDQLDSFSTPMAMFPWERDHSSPAARGHSPSSPQKPSTDVISKGNSEQKSKDLRRETDTCLMEVWSRVSALEEELCAKAQALKSSQEELMQSRKELNTSELSLRKAQDQLSLSHTRMAQESERASGAEQMLKQCQEELKCQRQNAESSRLQHQQRTKELEKQHHRDLSELQKERQCLEKQHQQEVNKLSQELQQARTLHNALQAQADKVSLQKQALDKEVETLKEKLKWTEGGLQESQKTQTETQAKLTEAVRAAEGVAMSLEQSRKRERALEEEGKRLSEERADALCLLKELQDQKAAPPPLLQTVQFYSAAPNFSSQSSSSHHLRPSTHTKRLATTAQSEQRREEDEQEQGAGIKTKYPTDREPGEGIDSEHITAFTSPDSEHLQRTGDRRSAPKDAVECDSSGTEAVTSRPVAATARNAAERGDHCISTLSDEKTPALRSEGPVSSEDLRKENAALRSELHDVREELQKRLEDLEAQRRAEAEARTRLKQLSRKHTSQAGEWEEKDREQRANLEREKAETDRLRKAMAALEAEVKREKEEREMKTEEEDEKKDRESEMIELNMQLKKQLAEVKAQLALEREERKREEHQTDIKLVELEAELEEIKKHGKKDLLEEKNLFETNSAVTYLTLPEDELNSNTVGGDSKLIPLPEQHHLFCQSTNQHNVVASQTIDLIPEERTGRVLQHSLSSERQTTQDGQMGRAVDTEDYSAQNEGMPSLSDQTETPSDLQKDVSDSLDLIKEVERLLKDNAREAERANQLQAKLEALQSQVTCQTQQLTTAFDKQSQHISGLLAELQQKEGAFLSQGETLQRCRQELDALKAEKMEKEEKRGEEGRTMKAKAVGHDEQNEISQHQLQQEKNFAKVFHAADLLTDTVCAQRDAAHLDTMTSDSERSAASSSQKTLKEQNPDRGTLWSELPLQGSDADKTQRNNEPGCVQQMSHKHRSYTEDNQDGGTASLAAELLALQQENQQLKQRIEAFTVLNTSDPALQANSEKQESTVQPGKSVEDAAPPRSEEQKANISMLIKISAEGQSVKKSEDGGGNFEREDKRTFREEETSGADSEHQISLLKQQIVALQTKLQAVSEENKQQAEELSLWKLASEPVPTFDQDLPNIDSKPEIQDKTSAIRQSQSDQQQTDNMSHILLETQTQTLHQTQAADSEKLAPLSVLQSPGNVTIIREDELFLSCSSSKLHGRMLASRLQHSNASEPKSLHLPKKTSAHQEHLQDLCMVDKESEKENVEMNFSKSSSVQHKEKKLVELIQMSSDKTSQQLTAKDCHRISAPKQLKTAACHSGDLQGKPDVAKATDALNTTSGTSERDGWRKMNATTQTEERLYPLLLERHHVYTQTEKEEDEELAVSPSISLTPLSEAMGDKMLFSSNFPIPADPARLAERIRRNRTQLSAAFDDTEYEPYGLPEVVMKGFADIPSGPSCPYIVRRGLLGTDAVPIPQKEAGQGEETD